VNPVQNLVFLICILRFYFDYSGITVLGLLDLIRINMTCLLIHSHFAHSFIYLLTHSLTHIHSPTLTHAHSLTFTFSLLTHSHSLTQSLTHALSRSYEYAKDTACLSQNPISLLGFVENLLNLLSLVRTGYLWYHIFESTGSRY
jgi:hypothetical protein